MTNVAAPFEANAGHELLRCGEMRLEFVSPVDAAVLVVKLDAGRRHCGELALADGRIRFTPRGKPSIDHRMRTGVDGVGNQIGKERQLVPPALDVLITGLALREFVGEL